MTKWGILSTGMIADKFAVGLRDAPGAELLAVGSRAQASADAFGETHHIPRRYDSYAALAADPDVEVIYIGTPHPMHRDDALLCIDAGKAVLLEKPFTLNARDTQTVIDRARAKNVFLMEAMWTRCTPIMVRVREILASGVLGAVRMVTADFGFRMAFDPAHRLFNPDLGGGALLDIGIYPVSLASMIYGMQPRTIISAAHIGSTGVDEQNALIFQYDEGAIAQLSSASRTQTPHEAIIMGEYGMIRIDASWWVPQRMTLHLEGREPEVIKPPFVGNGYNYEAVEVMRCLAAGETESPVMPLDETRAIMETMDTIRAQWGLVYPAERA